MTLEKQPGLRVRWSGLHPLEGRRYPGRRAGGRRRGQRERDNDATESMTVSRAADDT